jgi:hypothetical protein
MNPEPGYVSISLTLLRALASYPIPPPGDMRCGNLPSRGGSPTGGYFVPNNLCLDCFRVTLRTGFLWGCPESSWLPAQPLSSPVLRRPLDDAALCLRLRYPYSRAQTDVPSALSSPLHGVEGQSRPWGTPPKEVDYVLSTRHQGGRTFTDKVVELSANTEPDLALSVSGPPPPFSGFSGTNRTPR